MADSFVPITFVADELLTSTKMNLLAANQAGFHDGTALGDGIIVTRHLNSTAFSNPVSADANGWYRFIVGGKKIWRKKGTISVTVGGGAWSTSGGVSLPVGMSTIGSNHVSGSCAADDRAITSSIGGQASGSTSIVFAVSNQYTGAVTTNLQYSLEICEL